MESLPTDIILQIFSLLPTESRLSLAAVSSRFLSIASRNDAALTLFHSVTLTKPPSNLPLLRHLRVSSLVLSGKYEASDRTCPHGDGGRLAFPAASHLEVILAALSPVLLSVRLVDANFVTGHQLCALARAGRFFGLRTLVVMRMHMLARPDMETIMKEEPSLNEVQSTVLASSDDGHEQVHANSLECSLRTRRTIRLTREHMDNALKCLLVDNKSSAGRFIGIQIAN